MFKFILALFLINLSGAAAWGSNTHGTPSATAEQQAWWADAFAGYVATGCAPSTSGNTTVPTFACTAYAVDSNQMYYIAQTTSPIGPLTGGDGQYWLAMHRTRSDTVSGCGGGNWTRHGSTHYMWCLNATKPAAPTGGLVFMGVTVAGGAITAVHPEAPKSPQVTGQRSLHVRDFGADGVGDDQAAIQAAIDALPTTGGEVLFGDVYGAMTYTVNSEILVNTDQVYLRGLGKNTTLKAGAGSMSIIRFAASDGGVRGFTLDCDSQASSVGLSVAPEDETQVTTRVDQNFNEFVDMIIQNCTDGIRQVTGPDVGGADSGNWYNLFQHLRLVSNVRGAHLIDHPTDASVSQVNRNNWFDIRFHCPGGSTCNVGLHIDAGSTNTFTAVHFEGIAFGTSPFATPTAIAIQGQSRAGADNNDNVFFGPIFEANTRNIFIEDANANFNKVIGHNISDLTTVVDNGSSTFFLGTVQVVLPPVLVYDGTTARADMNPVNGVQVLGSGHQRLFINGVKASTIFGTNAQLTVTAPNSDSGYPLAVFTDSIGRGVGVLSNNFDNATNTGTSIQLSNTGTHIQATSSGFSAGTALVISSNGLRPVGALFAALGTPADGTVVYCSDCTPNVAPCTGSSTGAIAKRLNGAWDCR